MKKLKAQGSLEYLLMIGVVVLIAAIVVAFLTGTLSLGNAEATKNKGDKLYSGLEDIIDLSKNKTTAVLILKPGENTIEFESLLTTDTILELFSNLAIETRIQYNNSPNCQSVDATKQDNHTYTQTNDTSILLNDCIVPDNTRVTITIPENAENQEINYDTKIGEEGYITLTADKENAGYSYISPTKFIDTLRSNKGANIKLEADVGNEEEDKFSNTTLDFEGVLNGNDNTIVYSSTYIFRTLKNSKISNLKIYNPDITILNNFYFANSCINSTLDISIIGYSTTYQNCNN